ncbi:DUF7094 domain-containing protein [Halomicrobium salinisoli]|uniref:DUF7094 domain-containing protein n=1 Tax=Halomicrobium salinisoli TaxID=2878391 RepID=UPI001CF00C89|nr:hypothetical protein [Halomicrobium salinisoli]
MRPSMVHATALLLVAAAVTAPVGAATAEEQRIGPGHPHEVAAVEGFSNYLTIPADEVRSSTTTRTGIDLSTAAAADGAQLDARYDRLAFRQAFREADSDEERVQAVREVIGAAERRHVALQQRRSEAMGAHSNGTIPTDQFVRTMAHVDASARDLRRTVRAVDDRVASSGLSLPAGLDNRMRTLSEELVVMSGPVGQRLTDASTGTSGISSVYVESSLTGYTMAVIDGNTYHRETYLGSERNTSAPDQFRESDQYVVDAANERGRELYPWVRNETNPFGRGLGGTSIYLFRGDYDGGQLRAYLDGGTTDVFREHQHQRVDDVPVSETLRFENQSVDVEVERTYQTGPMRVNVTDARTGEPVDGTVRINGDPVGHTGSDGELWTVEPRAGVPVTVVTDDGRSVTDRLPP